MLTILELGVHQVLQRHHHDLLLLLLGEVLEADLLVHSRMANLLRESTVEHGGTPGAVGGGLHGLLRGFLPVDTSISSRDRAKTSLEVTAIVVSRDIVMVLVAHHRWGVGISNGALTAVTRLCWWSVCLECPVGATTEWERHYDVGEKGRG